MMLLLFKCQFRNINKYGNPKKYLKGKFDIDKLRNKCNVLPVLYGVVNGIWYQMSNVM